jgi:peptide/nickel transport system permease protein
MTATLLREPTARAALLVILLVALLAVFGPWLAPQDPIAQHPYAILEGSSARHWLGTDGFGRDVFSRLLAGSTSSVLASLFSVAIGLSFGVVPGILSAFVGARLEWLSLRFAEALMMLPFLVFSIAMTAILGNGLTQAMFAVGILIAPAFFRVSRAAALAVVNTDYIEAARLMGASTLSIVRRHVLRKIAPAIAITTASMTGACLSIVASLTFLGIGVSPPAPTWGGLLATDLGTLYERPFGPIVPGLLIVATVWSLNRLADALRDFNARPQETRA